MGLIMDLVRAIRNARAEYDVKPGAQIAAPSPQAAVRRC